MPPPREIFGLPPEPVESSRRDAAQRADNNAGHDRASRDVDNTPTPGVKRSGTGNTK